METGGKLGQVFDSSQNIIELRSGAQSPSSARYSIRGEDSSIAPGSGGQKARQSQLSALPPARDELVCRGRGSKDNQLQVGKFDAPRDLELGRIKDGSNLQVVFRVYESSGIGGGVKQPVARVRMAPARRDMLLFWSGNSFRLLNRQSLLRVSWFR